MRRIVKIASVLAAVAALASCQKEGSANTEITEGKSGAVVPTEIVASFEATKVSYAAEGNNLRPSWEVGDQVIALDEEGANYKFTVKAVNEDKSAVLSGEAPADCSLHLIYCPGVSADKLTVDYTAQTGVQKTMPAVMFSDGKLENRTGVFKFRNAGAIIGISAVKGVPSGSAISKITVEGENLSAADIALSGSALALTATTKAGDAISTATLSGITTTDANGTLSSPVFIAVPAGAKIAKVSVAVQAREPETMTIPSTAPDKEGVDYVTIAGKKWAKWNVGANSQTDYGWYFPWAGTEGYVYKNSKWVSASGVDTYSYTLSSAKTANASDYLYVKTQSFTPAGFSFDWAHTPFNNGSSNWNDTYFNSVRNTVCPGGILALDYDAAHVNWGDPWRMPTSAEFQALYNATCWAWDATDKGYYVTKKDEALSADKSNALLFFPTAGIGSNARLDSVGSYGIYWSSSLNMTYLYHTYNLCIISTGVYPSNNNGFHNEGYSIRAISD